MEVGLLGNKEDIQFLHTQSFLGYVAKLYF